MYRECERGRRRRERRRGGEGGGRRKRRKDEEGEKAIIPWGRELCTPSSSDSHHHHFPIAVLPSSTVLKFTPTHPQQQHSHTTTTAFVVSNLACSFSAPLDLIVSHEGQKEAGRGGGKHLLFAFSLSLMCVPLCVSSSSYLLCCFFLGAFFFPFFLFSFFCWFCFVSQEFDPCASLSFVLSVGFLFFWVAKGFL